MKFNVLKAATYLEHSYWKHLGIHWSKCQDEPRLIVHDKSLGRNRFLNKKYLDRSLKLISNYYHGKRSAERQTLAIKQLQNLLFMYTAIIGYKNVHFYKLLITANNRHYHYHKGLLIDNTGSLAVPNMQSSLKAFKKRLTRTHSSFLIHALRIRIKYYRQLHVHGLATGTIADPRVTSARWTNWLSHQLGYHVNVKLSPLIDYQTQSPVILSNRSANPSSYYQAIQQWLTYINRSYKLAFPNTRNPEADVKKWNQLTYRQQTTYISDTLNSTKNRSIHLNFNARYSMIAKRLIKYVHAIYMLAYIAMKRVNLTNYQQSSLFTQSFINQPQAAPVSSHHYTSSEQWQRANRIQMKRCQDIIKLGLKWLAKALSNNTYLTNYANKKDVIKDDNAVKNGYHTYSFASVIEQLQLYRYKPT